MNSIDQLDEFLSSDASSQDSMQVADLDGFLTGLACTPVSVEPSEWMPVCLGNLDAVPNAILDLTLQRYGEILDRLQTRRDVEPVFWQASEGHVIAMDWCEGFMDAVKLRPDVWKRFLASNRGAELMTPILVHMIDDQGNSVFGIAQEDLPEALDIACENIPQAVAAVFKLIRKG